MTQVTRRAIAALALGLAVLVVPGTALADTRVRMVGDPARTYEIWAWEDGELVAIDSVESFLD